MLKKLLVKYKSVPAPAKASFWFLICSFVQKGISMLTTPIYTRIMTESQFGRFSVYSTWYSFLLIIASLELASGVFTKGLVKNEGKADAFSSSMLSLSTTCIFIFSIVYFAFHNQINALTGLSTYLMAMMIIEMWTAIAFQFWSSRERVEYRYKKLVLFTIAFTIIRPIVGVAAVLLADEAYQLEARVTATMILNVILFSGFYFSIMRKGKVFFSKAVWKYALCFNLPLLPHYLSQVILNSSDRIMIEKMCSNEAVGYYSVAYSLAMVMQIFNSSVSATMNPWIYRSIRDKEYKKIGSASYTVLIAIAGINFAMVAFGPELLRIMAPANFYQAVWIIPPITASVYFTFLYNLFATFEFYYNKTTLVMAASLSGAVLNVILNLIFIPRFGFVAAGYTTLVSYMLYAFMHYIFMVRICKRNMDGFKVYDVKKILAIGFMLIGSCAVMLPLYEHPIIRYAVLLVVLIIAFLLRKRIVGVFREMKKI